MVVKFSLTISIMKTCRTSFQWIDSSKATSWKPIFVVTDFSDLYVTDTCIYWHHYWLWVGTNHCKRIPMAISILLKWISVSTSSRTPHRINKGGEIEKHNRPWNHYRTIKDMCDDYGIKPYINIKNVASRSLLLKPWLNPRCDLNTTRLAWPFENFYPTVKLCAKHTTS